MLRGRFSAKLKPLFILACSLFVFVGCASESESSEPDDGETNDGTDNGSSSGAPSLPPHTHAAVLFSEEKPTCTKDGNIEYWFCADCGKYFSDEECLDEITEADTVVKSAGHSSVTDAAVSANCLHTGLTEGSHCGTCGTVLIEQMVVGIAPHKFVNGKCLVCDEWEEAVGLEFEPLGDGYAVAGVGNCNSEFIRIPDTYDGKPVIKINDYAFSEYDGIKGVIIPDGVKEIGEMAFNDCPNLEELYMGNGVTDVGLCAFARCVKLDKAVFSAGLETIGMQAFNECESLTEIDLPQGLKTIETYAFLNCVNLGKVTLRSGLEEIESGAFEGCEKLVEIIFDGTRAEWNEVNDNSGGEYTVRCKDD